MVAASQVVGRHLWQPRRRGTARVVGLGRAAGASRHHIARLDEAPLSLTPREYGILEVLVLAEGRVVSKPTMREALCAWDDDLSSAALDVHVHRLRRKIERGMGFRAFLVARVQRLGPLFVIGLLLGLLAVLVHLALDSGGPLAIQPVLIAFGLNLLVLPYLNRLEWPFDGQLIPGPIFPLNDPAWSLFFEMFVNLVFFVCLAELVRRKRVQSGMILITAGSMLVFNLGATPLFDPTDARMKS